jgi:hypothetical protein
MPGIRRRDFIVAALGGAVALGACVTADAGSDVPLRRQTLPP